MCLIQDNHVEFNITFTIMKLMIILVLKTSFHKTQFKERNANDVAASSITSIPVFLYVYCIFYFRIE